MVEHDHQAAESLSEQFVHREEILVEGGWENHLARVDEPVFQAVMGVVGYRSHPYLSPFVRTLYYTFSIA